MRNTLVLPYRADVNSTRKGASTARPAGVSVIRKGRESLRTAHYRDFEQGDERPSRTCDPDAGAVTRMQAGCDRPLPAKPEHKSDAYQAALLVRKDGRTLRGRETEHARENAIAFAGRDQLADSPLVASPWLAERDRKRMERMRKA